MKKVGLLTTFYEAMSEFSLIAVAGTQLQMLLSHGYEPAVLVQENFTEPPAPSLWRSEMLDLRPAIPFLHLTSGIATDFEERVERILEALRAALEDVQVCITHDIILQSTYKEHNVAMRRYAKERSDLLWLHFIHSCPSPGSASYPEDCRYTTPPGYVVYPNASDLPRVCQTYQLGGNEWRAIANRASHSIDPLSLWPYDGLTRDLIEKSDHLAGEISAVYPARLDRGKQPEKIIRLFAGVKKLGYEPRLLIIDWQSMGEHFQKYIDELLDLSAKVGLLGAVNFTSRLNDACSQGIPRRVVMELMDLSNVYVHPSAIETYSLTVHEAMLRGNLCVLNGDLPVMRELWGECGIYFDFSSDRTSRTYSPTEQAFWNDEAVRLVSEFKQNRAVQAKTKARREWSPGAMWKSFAPLLFLPPVGAE